MKTEYIVLISIIIFAVIVGILMAVSKSTAIPNSIESVDRDRTLGKAFTAMLGKNWPVILSVIIFLLFLFSFALFLILKEVTINIDKKQSRSIFIALIVFTIVFTLSMLGLIGAAIIKSMDEQTSVSYAGGEEIKYEPYEERARRVKTTIIVIGASILGGGILAIILYSIFKK